MYSLGRLSRVVSEKVSALVVNAARVEVGDPERVLSFVGAVEASQVGGEGVAPSSSPLQSSSPTSLTSLSSSSFPFLLSFSSISPRNLTISPTFATTSFLLNPSPLPTIHGNFVA
ncbi:MAG: hypothetical protein O7C59_01295 [Rickettsia endosymbiont of Ixodes persulcatus]|nr:hypothetical protein [Rickettsia endosymbiont of Ixodes persulcatus]